MTDTMSIQCDHYFPVFNQCQRIAVVGDLMVDEFIFDDVSRVSPEAPVPVLGIMPDSDAVGRECAQKFRTNYGCNVLITRGAGGM